jgi:hypothetical protein
MKLGDRNWQHPEHVKGIKPQKIFDNIVLGDLTDRQIDKYEKMGLYSSRRYYRKELKKLQMEKALFAKKEKRLIYNIETQEFELREF